MQQRVLICLSAVIALLFMAEAGAAQGLSVGLGGSAMSSSAYMEHEPLTASVRFGLSQLIVEVEWMSQTQAGEFFDSGQSRVLPLNGQFGEYGRTTRRFDYTREAAGASLLLRSRLDRITGWGGAGVAVVRSTAHDQGTWTGCTGPWVAHCTTGNHDRTSEQIDAVPQVVGGVDVNLTRWIQIYGGGRAAMLAGGFDAGLSGGVRVSVVPERGGRRVWVTLADGSERSGRLLRRSDQAITLREPAGDATLSLSSVRLLEKSDSILNGALWGMVFGTLAGWEVKSQGSGGRGMAGAMIAGIGIGMAIDELIPGRQVIH
jgi:hypothetical protein